MMEGIDPAAWLKSHDPAFSISGALDCGRVLLDEYDGNGWITLHAQPELAIEHYARVAAARKRRAATLRAWRR